MASTLKGSPLAIERFFHYRSQKKRRSLMQTGPINGITSVQNMFYFGGLQYSWYWLISKPFRNDGSMASLAKIVGTKLMSSRGTQSDVYLLDWEDQRIIWRIAISSGSNSKTSQRNLFSLDFQSDLSQSIEWHSDHQNYFKLLFT